MTSPELPDPDPNAAPNPYEALDEIAEVVKDTRRFTIVSCALTILIIFAGGIGFAVWLSSTTNTANENSQQISTAKTVASVAKAAAAQTKTTVVQIQQQGFENSEGLRKLAECAQRSANVGDCIGQKQVPGTVRQGKEGRQGIPGRSATQAQVDAAVRRLCGGSCKGDVGTAGADATPEQIAAALAAYCSANNGCKGPSGENTAISPDQVAAAVKTYCDARNNCRGETGPAGDTVTGPQGPPGPAGANGTDAPPPTQEQVNAGVAAFCAANPAACQAPVAPAPPATP